MMSRKLPRRLLTPPGGASAHAFPGFLSPLAGLHWPISTSPGDALGPGGSLLKLNLENFEAGNLAVHRAAEDVVLR
jgi:hypothetical protein